MILSRLITSSPKNLKIQNSHSLYGNIFAKMTNEIMSPISPKKRKFSLKNRKLKIKEYKGLQEIQEKFLYSLKVINDQLESLTDQTTTEISLLK